MFPFTISDKGVTVFIDGQPRSFATDHPNYRELREAVEAGDEVRVTELADVRATIHNRTLGRVQIFDNQITVKGRVVRGLLVDRILGMIARGAEAVDGYIRFLDRAESNPGVNSTDELYGFIEHCNLPITPDGFFLAYKKVRENYTDIHSGKFNNSVGAVCSMPRSDVDDNSHQTCSTGLHFCSEAYLPHFGCGPGSRVMVVKVDPADVVSIPVDYNNSKGRACRYEVVGELEGSADRLTPWYSDEYEEDEEDEDEFDYRDDFIDLIGVFGFPDEPEHRDDVADDGFDLPLVAEPLVAENDEPVKRGQKLDADDVLEIVDLLDEDELTYTAIASMYGVHRETIARIDRGEIWNGLTGRRSS